MKYNTYKFDDANFKIKGNLKSETSDTATYEISGLEPNIKHENVFIISDGGQNVFSTIINTLPTHDQMPIPSFNKDDLSNIHSQPDPDDPDNKIAAYFKFDNKTDISWNKTIATAWTPKPAYDVTSYVITDNKANKQLIGKLEANPDTGTLGWCKVTDLKPGTKYSITIQSKCEFSPTSTTLSAPSSAVEFTTAPTAVKNIAVASIKKSNDGTYAATITFDSENGNETNYRTDLACKDLDKSGYVETPATKVSEGKYQIVISNIKKPTGSIKGVVVSLVGCPETVKTSPDVCKDFKCNTNVPSNKIYKKKDPVSGKFVEIWKDGRNGQDFTLAVADFK